MTPVTFIEVPGPTFGALFIVIWAIVFVGAIRRYQRGVLSLPLTYLWMSVALLWGALGVMQVVEAFSGTTAIVVETIGLGLFVGGIFLLVQWWRVRDTDDSD